MDTRVKFTFFLNFKIYLALWSIDKFFQKIKQIFETWWEYMYDKTTFYD